MEEVEQRIYLLIRFDIQKQGWCHRDCLLTSDTSASVLLLEQLMNLSQGVQFADLASRIPELPCHFVGIPCNRFGRNQWLAFNLHMDHVIAGDWRVQLPSLLACVLSRQSSLNEGVYIFNTQVLLWWSIIEGEDRKYWRDMWFKTCFAFRWTFSRCRCKTLDCNMTCRISLQIDHTLTCTLFKHNDLRVYSLLLGVHPDDCGWYVVAVPLR